MKTTVNDEQIEVNNMKYVQNSGKYKNSKSNGRVNKIDSMSLNKQNTHNQIIG